jgi:hypothetical protein
VVQKEDTRQQQQCTVETTRLHQGLQAGEDATSWMQHMCMCKSNVAAAIMRWMQQVWGTASRAGLETRVFCWEVPRWCQESLLGSDHRGAVAQATATRKCHGAGQKNRKEGAVDLGSILSPGPEAT